MRAGVHQAPPRQLPATCWKHAEVSDVEQPGVPPCAKNRGAEQGDVDGSVECSLTLGFVAAKSRAELHRRQRAGELPWADASEAAAREAAAEFDERAARAQRWMATPPMQRRTSEPSSRIIADPLHELQARGGIADFWYIDDGDVLIDPRLVQPYLEAFDAANQGPGAERNSLKTEVIYYASDSDMVEHASDWHLDAVRELASVRTAEHPGLTLGVVTGPADDINAQLQQKANVVRAMQEKVAVAADVQTEHVLNRECLGVGRVNHILRVHGHALQAHEGHLERFDGAMRNEMDRLFPGLTDEGSEQASLAVSAGGLGWRRA